MKKLPCLAAAAAALAAACAAYLYFDRRAMARERNRLAAPTDAMLARRVRARLGALLPDPEAIQVTAHDGVVTLRGEIERSDLDRCLRAALSVPGVKSVLNRLEPDAPPPAPDEGAGLQPGA
jgi:osmotically-inducible protein OsmY